MRANRPTGDLHRRGPDHPVGRRGVSGRDRMRLDDDLSRSDRARQQHGERHRQRAHPAAGSADHRRTGRTQPAHAARHVLQRARIPPGGRPADGRPAARHAEDRHGVLWSRARKDRAAHLPADRRTLHRLRAGSPAVAVHDVGRDHRARPLRAHAQCRAARQERARVLHSALLLSDRLPGSVHRLPHAELRLVDGARRHAQ